MFLVMVRFRCLRTLLPLLLAGLSPFFLDLHAVLGHHAICISLAHGNAVLLLLEDRDLF